MSFVNKFEHQDRFIEAFVQGGWHAVPKPVKIVFDKNLNLLLHRRPPVGTKPSCKSQACFSPSSLSLSSSLPQLGMRVGRKAQGREGSERTSVEDGEASGDRARGALVRVTAWAALVHGTAPVTAATSAQCPAHPQALASGL